MHSGSRQSGSKQSDSRFTRHLDDVDETYFEHLQHALSFALAMLWGAGCCVVHAFLPFLCEQSGSRTISRLHDRMVVNRIGLGKQTGLGKRKLGGKETARNAPGETASVGPTGPDLNGSASQQAG